MRLFLLTALPLFLAACGGSGEAGEDAPMIEAGTYLAADRGGMCVAAGGEAAFVLYGDGEANCMAEGRLSAEGSELDFTPRGDTQCTIPISVDGERLIFGEVPPACDYYCGGEVELAGREVSRSESAVPLTDVAGDDIC